MSFVAVDAVGVLALFSNDRVYATRRMRAGKGKLRNRRHVQKLGPLVIYDQDQGVTKAFRNIPGVDVIQVAFRELSAGCQPCDDTRSDMNYGRWTT